MFPWSHKSQQQLEEELQAHIVAPAFPCVGAKAALAKGNLTVFACDRIDSAWDDLRIHDSLLGFTKDYHEHPGLFAASRRCSWDRMTFPKKRSKEPFGTASNP
ncbi:YqcI/YcgG family protein [Sphingobium lactosutens]|uniref:YqcI/YcgG family protein n=1 Tax=Sphingobium lactosutens TaxID=522773 RepID=UPI002118BB30|nr:YqcI/YcgG family protein [Sphingobium lactosutens]